jgi:hypothetical protein
MSDMSIQALLKSKQASGVEVRKLRANRLGGLLPHGKLVIVDGRRAAFGSMSLSALSLDFRREIAVLVEDPRCLRKLKDFYRFLAGGGQILDPARAATFVRDREEDWLDSQGVLVLPARAASLPLVVAKGAVDAHLLGLMALHAPAHRDVAFFEKLISFGNLPVTVLAGMAGFEVRAVAVVHIGRDLVDPDPGHTLILFGVSRKLLNRGALALNRAVALHACGGRSDGHRLAGIRIRMAHLALQLQRSRVLLVAERNGLRRRVCGKQPAGAK